MWRGVNIKRVHCFLSGDYKVIHNGATFDIKSKF